MENKMADRSITDIIKFLDTNGNMSDADVLEVSRKLKFTEVLDLISAMKSDDSSTARGIIGRYTSELSQPTEEASTIPMIKPTTTTQGSSAFPKIAPKGTQSNSPTLGGTAQQQGDDGQDLNQLVNDPAKQNDPNVRQLKTILQRIGVK